MKAADFVNASKSFSVDLKMRQADSQIKAMQVPGTPTLVVAGKYRLNNDNLNTDQMIAAREIPGCQGKRKGRGGGGARGGSGPLRSRQEALTTSVHASARHLTRRCVMMNSRTVFPSTSTHIRCERSSGDLTTT